MKSVYNEELELDRYVINHFSHLMTDIEQLSQKTVLARQKAENSNSVKMKKVLIERWAFESNPEVLKALSGGVESFRRSVRVRILKTHKASVYLNRCKKCNNLVKTPKAQMCLWCNHSWHASS